MAADEFEALHGFWQHQIVGKNHIIRGEDELSDVIMKKDGSTKKVLDAFENRVKLGVQHSKAWTKPPKFMLPAGADDDDAIDVDDYQPLKKPVKPPKKIHPDFMKELTKQLSSVSERQDRLIAEKECSIGKVRSPLRGAKGGPCQEGIRPKGPPGAVAEGRISATESGGECTWCRQCPAGPAPPAGGPENQLTALRKRANGGPPAGS